MDFDGINDYVNFGDNDVLDYDDGFIFEAKFATTMTGVGIIAGKGDGVGDPRWVVYISGGKITGRFEDGVNDIFVRSPVGQNDGEAHTLRIIADFSASDSLQMFIDGEEVTYDRRDDPTSLGSMNNTIDLIVGAGGDPVAGFFDGVIRYVSISTLAGAEVWSALGDGITDANWEDQIGPVDGTVNGDPSLFDGVLGSSKFISSWQTDNTGTSNDNQITLPLLSSGTYDFAVDWGDGSSDEITAYNQSEVTHTYSGSGAYTVKISGTCRGFSFNNGGDKEKITEISQWGSLWLGNGSSGGHFRDAASLVVTATDAPNLTGCTSLAFTFRAIDSFTGSMAEWDFTPVVIMNYFAAYNLSFSPTTFGNSLSTTGNVERMYRAFIGTSGSVFNEDISALNISSINATATQSLDEMLNASGLSTTNYDAFLISMAAQAPTATPNIILGASGVQYSSAAVAARATLTGTYGWTITDGGLA